MPCRTWHCPPRQSLGKVQFDRPLGPVTSTSPLDAFEAIVERPMTERAKSVKERAFQSTIAVEPRPIAAN